MAVIAKRRVGDKFGARRKGSIIFTLRDTTNFFLLGYLFSISALRLGTPLHAAIGNVFYIGFIGLAVLGAALADKGAVKFKPYITWFVIFLLFCYFSYLWAMSPEDVTSRILIFRKAIFFTVAMCLHINTMKDAKVLFKLFYMTLALTAVFFVLQTPSGAWFTGRSGEAIGIHSVSVSVRGAMLSFMAFVYILNREKKQRVIHILVFLLGCFINISSGARQGVIYFCLMILFFLLFRAKDLSGKIGALLVSGIAATFFLVLVLYVPTLYNFVGYRFAALFGFVTGADPVTDVSAVERTEIMAYAREQFLANPFLGLGLNNLRAYLRSVNFRHATHAHNNFLELLSGLGIFGAAIYYSLYVMILKNAVKWRRHSNVFIPFVLSMILTFLVCDYFTSSYSDPHIISMFATIYLVGFISAKTASKGEGALLLFEQEEFFGKDSKTERAVL